MPESTTVQPTFTLKEARIIDDSFIDATISVDMGAHVKTLVLNAEMTVGDVGAQIEDAIWVPSYESALSFVGENFADIQRLLSEMIMGLRAQSQVQ